MRVGKFADSQKRVLNGKLQVETSSMASPILTEKVSANWRNFDTAFMFVRIGFID
jgi:hypothetical protein